MKGQHQVNVRGMAVKARDLIESIQGLYSVLCHIPSHPPPHHLITTTTTVHHCCKLSLDLIESTQGLSRGPQPTCSWKSK